MYSINSVSFQVMSKLCYNLLQGYLDYLLKGNDLWWHTTHDFCKRERRLVEHQFLLNNVLVLSMFCDSMYFHNHEYGYYFQLEFLCFLTRPLLKFLYCFLESRRHVSHEKFPQVIFLDLFVLELELFFVS